MVKNEGGMGGFGAKKYLQEAVERVLGGETLGEQVVEIPLDKIASNPFQPRRHFSKEALEGLADSIREKGVQEPVIVRKSQSPDSPCIFQLAAGERRLRASAMAGKETIPAVIRNLSDSDMAEVALIENLQREGLTAFETMMSIVGLKKMYGNAELLGKSIGLKKRSVEHYLKIFSGLSDVPELFSRVEKRQAGLSLSFLKKAADIAHHLKWLKKADKEKFERFFTKAGKKGIEKAVDDLAVRMEANERRVVNVSPDGLSRYANIVREGNGTLSLSVMVRTSRGISAREKEDIKEGIERFMERIEGLVQKEESLSVSGDSTGDTGIL